VLISNRSIFPESAFGKTMGRYQAKPSGPPGDG
jgi:hypothetical protein